MIEIIISHFANPNRKYANYMGYRFSVLPQIDNFGDYCIGLDKGQPFMFIAAKDCILINS